MSECTGADCFGVAPNYGSVFSGGSLATNMSCIYADGDDPLHVSPFQSTGDLIKHFGASNMFSTRELMHKQSNVCKRLECDPLHQQLFDGNKIWILYESIINGVFLIELGVRMSVSFSLSDYFFDRMNILDILCVSPFFIDLLVTVFSKGGINSMDLAFTASTPDPLILVLLRSFKVRWGTDVLILPLFMYILIILYIPVFCRFSFYSRFSAISKSPRCWSKPLLALGNNCWLSYP